VRSLASIIFGLIAGWLTITEPARIPESWKKEIGEYVAHNQLIEFAIKNLSASTQTTYSIKFWLIILMVSAIPLFVYASAATAVFLWSNKSRQIFYGSLCYPVFIILSAVFSNFYDTSYEPYIRKSITYAEVNLFNTVIYFIFLYILITLSKSYTRSRKRA
jgi:hypothetical protein